MSTYIYDCEVFAHDWLIVFKNFETGEYKVFHNDNALLKDFINEHDLYIGFNSKNYDRFIIKSICNNDSPEEVKLVNDFIIGGGNGWKYPPLLNSSYLVFNNVDIMDDMQMGLSLKAIEGHLGMDIEETEVDFNLDRALSRKELELTLKYCKHDVDATAEIVKLRKEYLNNKLQLGKLAGLSEAKALSMTNAKLTAELLQATRQEHDDERSYVYPENLLREYIPQEVFDFFDRIFDKTISSEDLFSSKLEMAIGECDVTLGFGGIHGAILNFMWKQHDGRVIRNVDVGSYYPHLMTINGYTSRNIPSPEIFENILDRRMKAKAQGDKQTANALKLVVNTTYGATLNNYNALYDPLMARSVCISGQLYLLELSMNLYTNIKDLRIIQLNTDGVMVELNEEDLPKLHEICKEWETRTQFELEEDKVIKLAQKDVNNYLEVQEDGEIKCKGSYLVRGIAKAGAFNVNNNATIVAKALRNYLSDDISIEDTINDCNDILEFQMIAKASSKYSGAFQLVNDERIPTQKVNRVYASNDETLGTLYKVKKETGAIAKIESLPEHCIIDNSNKLTINDVNKQWYIDLANSRLNDFLGIERKRTKKVAEKASKPKETKEVKQNVYSKLLNARQMFLDENVKKSGKNTHLTFMYFELEDIVPTATNIFKELGLITLVNFTDTVATMDVVNIDDSEQVITFTAPFNQIQPIVSNTGKQATNSMQALGASITYMRRYLYMLALDIVENDESDATVGQPLKEAETTPVVKPVVKKATAPATPVERKEVKEELTAVDEPASDLQIKGLKNVLKKLRELQPDSEEFITKVAVESNGFTTLTKEQCEKLINGIQDKISEVENG